MLSIKEGESCIVIMMCMIKKGYKLREKKGLRSTAKSTTDLTKTINNNTTTITIKQQEHQ